MKTILADTGAILARVHFLFLILAVSTLACGGTYLVTPTPQAVSNDLYPSPSSEARVRVITTTPLPTLPTSTPIVVVQTTTPVPPSMTEPETTWLCVTAQEAVNLRPSPSTENHIAVLKNGEKVRDLGGRDGSWFFVAIGDKAGWINSRYLGQCK